VPDWFYTLEFWTGWLAAATTLVVVVAAWQIMALRRQAKGWQTLAACEKYDLDPVLDRCARKLAKAGTKKIRKNPERYKVEMITVLNYLDGVAIGIEQNLYVESIAWDHLEPMLIDHVTTHLTGPKAAVFGFDQQEYARLIKLSNKWREKLTRFTDRWSWFFWR
jgi:hypothetical protein